MGAGGAAVGLLFGFIVGEVEFWVVTYFPVRDSNGRMGIVFGLLLLLEIA